LYASRADIEQAYGADVLLITGDPDGDGQPDDAKITRALSRADGFIDTQIGRYYKLPLPHIPNVLRDAAVDLALYYLSSTADVLTDEVRQRYEDAEKLLIRIGEGKAALAVDTDGDGKEETAVPGVVSSGPPRMFSRQSLRDL
jgi:phage gp36-like protein